MASSNTKTIINYELQIQSFVTLSVYDINGKKIITLVNGIKDPGSNNINWSGVNDRGNKVGSGLYFYILKAGNETSVKKMALVK